MHINATLPGGDCPRTLELNGRLGWTMYQLVEAGPRGVSPLEHPALRWSGYIHALRNMGIPIETEMEDHGGAYKGRHARYRLVCEASISILPQGGL